jgi:hypothetical protein
MEKGKKMCVCALDKSSPKNWIPFVPELGFVPQSGPGGGGGKGRNGKGPWERQMGSFCVLIVAKNGIADWPQATYLVK